MHRVLCPVELKRKKNPQQQQGKHSQHTDAQVDPDIKATRLDRHETMMGSVLLERSKQIVMQRFIGFIDDRGCD